MDNQKRGAKLDTFYVYIILCEKNKLYTGVAKDPEARFTLHANGKGAKYTQRNKPIRIVYIEKFDSRSEALKREAQIKNLDKSKKSELIAQVL